MRCLLIATMKDEGPSILEWVAHHKRVGFDDILIYQNDSTDFSQATLQTLHRLGVIRYFDNTRKGAKGGWQPRAYTRAAYEPEHAAADWAMALDADEYLHVATPEGTVQSLIRAVCEGKDRAPDVIRMNWKIFGSSGRTRLTDGLVTKLFTRAEKPERIAEAIVGYKSLYRTSVFRRAGVHNPTYPLTEDWTEANGSGLVPPAYDNAGWRSTDPGLRAFGQVNHYMVRSAADYMMKCARGRSSHSLRKIRLRYWRNADVNAAEDLTLADRADDLADRMLALNEASNGRLMRYRARSVNVHRKAIRRAMEDEEWRGLYRAMTRAA